MISARRRGERLAAGVDLVGQCLQRVALGGREGDAVALRADVDRWERALARDHVREAQACGASELRADGRGAVAEGDAGVPEAGARVDVDAVPQGFEARHRPIARVLAQRGHLAGGLRGGGCGRVGEHQKS